MNNLKDVRDHFKFVSDHFYNYAYDHFGIYAKNQFNIHILPSNFIIGRYAKLNVRSPVYKVDYNMICFSAIFQKIRPVQLAILSSTTRDGARIYG
jgi:hypothetical protein